MKTMLSLGIAAAVLFAATTASEAGHRHHRHYRGNRIVYGGMNYGGMNVPSDLYTAPPFQYRGGYSGGYGNGYNGGYGGYGAYSNYGGYGGYGQPVWHDTSHYDYHPETYVPHGNHLHYVPGHYDLHQSGHYDYHP